VGVFPGDQIVVTQRRKIDAGFDRARHQADSSRSLFLAKSTKVSTTLERKRSFG
jgi:hypothetical protein